MRLHIECGRVPNLLLLVLYEREEPLKRLAAAAERGGRVVLVRGDAGIGKTSVVQTFLDTSQTHGLVGRCDDASVPLVLGPFREIFRQAGVPLDPTEIEDARARLGEVVDYCPCLVIEDLHWGDEATLDLVSYLGRRVSDMSLLLILTMRPSDDVHLVRCLAQMPDHTLDIELQPLSRSSVSAMATAVGRPTTKVFEQSNGNPFLVTEILASPDGTVPERVTHATLARLSHHSHPAIALAQLLSVFPRGAIWEDLESLRPDATTAVDELEKGRWLVFSAGRIGFRHELLRLAVEESLSTARRRRLNREVLDQLASSGADAATLAHHAEQAGDTKQFLETTIVAARQFARAGTHRDALTHLLRVESHSSLLPADEQARFAEALGVELTIGGRTSEARQRLVTASELWEELGDRNSQARVLSELSPVTWRLGDKVRSLTELEEALKLLADSDDRDLIVRTRVNRAQVIGMLSRWPDALAQLEMAMPEAVSVGGESLAMAYGIRGNARRMLGDDETGRSDQRAAIDLALRLGKEVVAMTSHTNRVAASLTTLDLAEIDDEFREALSLADEIQAGYARSGLEGLRCHLHELRGEWDTALAESSRLIEGTHAPVALIRPRTVGGSIQVRRGDDSGVALVEDARDVAGNLYDIQRLGPVMVALAELQWLGKVEASDDLLYSAGLARASGHVRYQAELSLWCHRLGIDGPDLPARGPAPLLAELRGDWQAAVTAWEDMGLPYYRTLTLAFSDNPDAMREAVVEASRLGASTTVDRIRARLRGAGHRVGRGPGKATLANPGGLTQRQVDVVQLLARSLTNQEIAAQLFISRKTVDHHVSAILTRLGVENRRRAGEWAIEEGLAPPR